KKPKKAKEAKGAKGAREAETSGGPSAPVGQNLSSAQKGRRPPMHDLEKAIHWFEREYPGGFSNEALLRDEIRFKRDAHQMVADRLGGGLGRALLDGGHHAEAATLLSVLYQSTTIPSRFEIMAAHDGLKVPEAGAALLDALLGFLDTPGAEA